MATQDRVSQTVEVKEAIAASQEYLLSQQYSDGYWCSELESNVTITAEAVLLHKIWGTDESRPLAKAETYLRSQQREHGGWELFYGDGGDLSTSVEAYMALRLLGVPASDPAMSRARKIIIDLGGISKTRIFTKLHLALIGCYDWRGIPSIPPWIMLLPEWFPFTIYEMSSWARSSTVPLVIVCDHKPVFPTNPRITLDELYAEGVENVKYTLPKNNDWTDCFVWLDGLFKLGEKLNLLPLRQAGLKAAEKWTLSRQEATGDWGGIIPAMLNSLLALRCLEYSPHDPIVVRGLQAVDNFAIETEDTYLVQACVSPVWDTTWVVRALTASGVAPNHPALVKGSQWLLDKQILDYGDWAVKNKQGKPGSWAFEFDNRFYPDLDDSGVIVMTLQGVELPNEEEKLAAMERCLEWMVTMQCKNGGWAAFDIDNNQDWLNSLPYADLKAMIDPATADITARVLEMLGELSIINRHEEIKPSYAHLQVPITRGINYLIAEQEPEGCWFGRWGVNYIYGTSGALAALSLVAPITHRQAISRGVNYIYGTSGALAALSLVAPITHRQAISRGVTWLIGCQNSDGGWGETCRSYDDPTLKGKGVSTPSQTAWALIGLIAAKDIVGDLASQAITPGINYLISTQNQDGTWEEAEFTGTGFPSHFYLRYHFYCQYFPLLALSHYQKLEV